MYNTRTVEHKGQGIMLAMEMGLSDLLWEVGLTGAQRSVSGSHHVPTEVLFPPGCPQSMTGHSLFLLELGFL